MDTNKVAPDSSGRRRLRKGGGAVGRKSDEKSDEKCLRNLLQALQALRVGGFFGAFVFGSVWTRRQGS
jgi:hypothetical protein